MSWLYNIDSPLAIDYQDHPAIIDAKADALARAIRYGIKEPVEYNKQLGFCWLVAGGPKHQTYRSEQRIIQDYERQQAIAAQQAQQERIAELVSA